MSKINIFSLGGLNENGKNMYVVCVDDDILVLEAGLQYADEQTLGIDYMIPQFLGSLLSKLIALILIVCLKKFFHDENIKNLPNRYNFILLLIPIGSMFVVYNIFMLSIEINQKIYILHYLEIVKKKMKKKKNMIEK